MSTLTDKERVLSACPYYQSQNGCRPREGAHCVIGCQSEPVCMEIGPGVRLPDSSPSATTPDEPAPRSANAKGQEPT